MKKYKVLNQNPKRKVLDKNLVLPIEAKHYFQNFFKDEKLRRILALKEGEVAVGLVEGTVEDPELSEEESEEEETSLKRDTSRLNANTGLKSRKVSGMSQLSSSLRSPSSPR